MTRPWTPEEDAVLLTRYADTETSVLAGDLQRNLRSLYDRAQRLGLKKSKALRAELSKRTGNGIASRFQPGLIPWNKGLRYPGFGNQETQFKVGHVPHNHKPLGHERVNAEGYRERKVRDESSSRTGASNYRQVHVLLWEQHHGPVPDGKIIVFRNGNKSDLRIENLEPIDRAELMRRNSFHNWPEDIRAVIHAKARLTRVIHEMEESQ